MRALGIRRVARVLSFRAAGGGDAVWLGILFFLGGGFDEGLNPAA
jgi:hypothetical protein